MMQPPQSADPMASLRWENDDSVREAAVSGRHLQHAAEKTGQEEDKSLAS
ncbi:unnamed protein product [Arabidopsis lyrata]|nr:unnamed protein product [Arabidopsis lyrata]